MLRTETGSSCDGRPSADGRTANALGASTPGEPGTQWFKVPPEVHYESDALSRLDDMLGLNRVTLVTGLGSRRRGHVGRVVDVLGRRPLPPDIDVVDDVEPDPAFNTVKRAADRMRTFAPDTVIALGGGSVMSAAKVMRLLCEHSETQFADMREKFFDGRQRTFGGTGSRIRLVCVPTTAGSGAEVTPFATLTDSVTGLQYPMADHVFTPDVALCDPAFTSDLPPTITADSGFDALTHAVEAFVSLHASDLTDGLCLTAARLVLDHLERAVRDGPADSEARLRMLNAGTIAGMASGNACLGLVHAMAHSLGATFCIPHGRANALLLPHVIRYNGTAPAGLGGSPTYETRRTLQRFQRLARHLDLPAAAPHQAVEELARAVENLRDRAGIPPSFQAAGVDETAFLSVLPQQAVHAYKDRCTLTNPRMPLLRHIEGLMRAAYYGTDSSPNSRLPRPGQTERF